MPTIGIEGARIDAQGNQMIQIVLIDDEKGEKGEAVVLGEAFLTFAPDTPQAEIEAAIITSAKGIADKTQQARLIRQNLTTVEWPKISL